MLLKHLGRWKSDSVAQRYVVHSDNLKQSLANLIQDGEKAKTFVLFTTSTTQTISQFVDGPPSSINFSGRYVIKSHSPVS